MRIEKDPRGFNWLIHPKYLNGLPRKLVHESSAVGDYEDALDVPGSSFLWIGEDHHLNREEVSELVHYLRVWLNKKRLSK